MVCLYGVRACGQQSLEVPGLYVCWRIILCDCVVIDSVACCVLRVIVCGVWVSGVLCVMCYVFCVTY